ncbi:ribonuclease R [Chiayiivirga flava]|uniref:Ribonuclease R n=1 Tax=Chiayiivirga flava TaxID=659595 RepID=A0A7W8D7L5_9GAMM|nr:ribonuclease R [Chiayiivirga flava]MBB5209398.1 ribonuclease R [Chiayiivirga flava]
MKKSPRNRRGASAQTEKSLPPWMPQPVAPLPATARGAKTGAGARGKPAAEAVGKGAAKAAARKAAATPAARGGGGKTSASGRATPASAPGKGKPRASERPQAPTRTRKGGPAPAAPTDRFAEREASRYENPIISREGLLALLAESNGPMTAEQLAAQLDLTAPDRFEALSRRLAAMQRDGQVLANRRGAYAVAEQLDLVKGTVIANPEGFGFLRTDSGGDDLFLPPAELRKAMHGDRVLASVTGVDRRGRREGAIVEVLERRLTRIIGRYGERGAIGFVAPDDRRVLHEVMIPPDAREGAREGQLVVCEILEPPARGRPPFGRILTVLGDKLTPSLVVEAAIHGHGIPHEFPQETIDEATAVPLEVDAATIAARVDLRAVPLVTIDGEDAKDFDDAVWCEPNRGGFRLIVAIADVSSYVRPGTALDDEAQTRATSVYFPGFVVPMLPETLSNGICSLKPDVVRLCFVCDMQIDRDGNVTKSKFYEAAMRSHARLTYTQVWKAVGENDAEAIAQIGGLLPRIQALHQLYRVLAKARAKRGAIEFESSEVRFVLGSSGDVEQAGMVLRNDAHKLIEECMIAANVEAAKFLLASGIPAPYRIHDRPPEQKYADLLEFLGEFGLRMPPWQKVTPGDFTALLKKVRERADGGLIESVLLRSQSLAVYSTENIGHFGLALEAYAHFTSPIRRYPDLLVHRAIKHVLKGGKASDFLYAEHDMVALALQCSERGRRAEEAEREVDERYRAAWMEQHVGSEFDGVISGVTSFGLFVELETSKVNGLVHVTQLPNDYYHFDPIRKMLSGERTGVAHRLGDRVRIVVLRASLEDRRIDFRLVPLRAVAAAAPQADATLATSSADKPQHPKRKKKSW